MGFEGEKSMFIARFTEPDTQAYGSPRDFVSIERSMGLVDVDGKLYVEHVSLQCLEDSFRGRWRLVPITQ